MGIPHVPEQVRRAPLLALRAVFAGIGRVLMVADRPVSVVVVEESATRFRSLDQTGNVRILPAQPAQPAQAAQESGSALDEAPAREPWPALDEAPAQESEPALDEAPAQEPALAQEPAGAPDATPAQEATPTADLPGDGARRTPPAPAVADVVSTPADLPLPNYDALSLASIRARLRYLDVAELTVLLDYEAANAERAEVLGMFERRIQKLEADG